MKQKIFYFAIVAVIMILVAIGVAECEKYSVSYNEKVENLRTNPPEDMQRYAFVSEGFVIENDLLKVDDVTYVNADVTVERHWSTKKPYYYTISYNDTNTSEIFSSGAIIPKEKTEHPLAVGEGFEAESEK